MMTMISVARTLQLREPSDRLSSKERERLAERAARGDASAFNRLTTAFRPALLRYATRQAGDPHHAEDLVQDGLLRAWEMREHYSTENGGSWIEWCRQIVRHLAIDRWRRESSGALVFESVLGGDESFEGIDQFPSNESAADARLVDRERLESLREAVSRLPKRRRRVLQRWLEDRSVEEVAALEGISLKAAQLALYRARKDLRAAFGVKNPDLTDGIVVSRDSSRHRADRQTV